MKKVLSMCWPTFGGKDAIHYDITGKFVFLAPDEINKILLAKGISVDVVNLAQDTDKPLMRSGLMMKKPEQVDPNSYDLIIHMFRDPTHENVVKRLDELGWSKTNVRTLNNAITLASHTKWHYLPILHKHGLAARSYKSEAEVGSPVWTQSVFGATVDTNKKFIRTFARNNNRITNDFIVSDYVNTAAGALRSMFRLGVMMGKCCSGWLYAGADSQLIQKSGTMYHFVPYSLPKIDAERVGEVMSEIGVDYAHIEGAYAGQKLYIFDINAHPNTAGNTHSYTTMSMVDQLMADFLS